MKAILIFKAGYFIENVDKKEIFKLKRKIEAKGDELEIIEVKNEK